MATLPLLLGWAERPAMAQEEGEPKVRARLVAETAEIEPGSTFRVGVHFEIEDGWHIYWRYPGGAGLATAIDFELPEGFTIGPLQWPLPRVRASRVTATKVRWCSRPT
jgi:thiol:disulfide interchange protein DsbD